MKLILTLAALLSFTLAAQRPGDTYRKADGDAEVNANHHPGWVQLRAGRWDSKTTGTAELIFKEHDKFKGTKVVYVVALTTGTDITTVVFDTDQGKDRVTFSGNGRCGTTNTRVEVAAYVDHVTVNCPAVGYQVDGNLEPGKKINFSFTTR